MSVCVCLFVCRNVGTHFPWHMCREQRTTSAVYPPLLPGLRQALLFSTLYTKLDGHDSLGMDYTCVLLCLALCGFWGTEHRSSCLPGKHFPNAPVSSAHVHTFHLTVGEVGSLQMSTTRLKETLIRTTSLPKL